MNLSEQILNTFMDNSYNFTISKLLNTLNIPNLTEEYIESILIEHTELYKKTSDGKWTWRDIDDYKYN